MGKEIEEKLKIKEGELTKLEQDLKLNKEKIKKLELKQKELLEITGNEVTRMCEIRIKQQDHYIDISKFFISLSSTVILALLAIPALTNRLTLYYSCLFILGVSIGVLIINFKERKKVSQKYLDFFTGTRLESYLQIFKK